MVTKAAQDEIDTAVLAIVTRRNVEATEHEGAVIELCSRASVKLEKLVRRIFREQAVTPESVQKLAGAITILMEAMLVAGRCRREPFPGIVTKQSNGTLLWTPPDPERV